MFDVILCPSGITTALSQDEDQENVAQSWPWEIHATVDILQQD